MANIFNDSIYDTLFTERIDPRCKTLIANALGNHFPHLDAIWLIQRWHVHNVPWTENWTETAFDFLKLLSRTHLLTNGEINGEAYGFEPEYTADLPSSLSLPSFPDEVIFKVSKGKTGAISWIERSHDVVKATYCSRVTNEITCWHRNQRVITAPKDTDLEIKLDSRTWLINSVVIQDGELKGVTNEQKSLILYESLDQTLEDIYSQFNISECKVLSGCTAEVTTEWLYSENLLGNNFYSEYQWGANRTVEYTLPLFQSVPDHYCYAWLETANGIKKGRELTTVYDDDSETFSFYFVYEEDSYFNEWKKTHRYNSVFEDLRLELYPDQEFLKGDTGKTLGIIPSFDFTNQVTNTLPIVLNPYRDFRDGILPDNILVSAWSTAEYLKNYLPFTSNGPYPDIRIAYLPGDGSVWRKEYFIFDGIQDGGNIVWQPERGQHWRRLGDWNDWFSASPGEFLEKVKPLSWEAAGSGWIFSYLYGVNNFTRGPYGKRSRFWAYDGTPQNFTTIGGNPYQKAGEDTFLELLSDFDGSFSALLMTPDVDLDLFADGQAFFVNSCLNQARTRTTEWAQTSETAWVDPGAFNPSLPEVILAGGIIPYLLGLENLIRGSLLKEEIYYVTDSRKITQEEMAYSLSVDFSDSQNPIINLSSTSSSEILYENTIAGLTGSKNPAVNPSYLGSAYGYLVYDISTGGNADYLSYTQPFREDVIALFPNGRMSKTVSVDLRRAFRFQPRSGRFVVKSWDSENNYYLYRELTPTQVDTVLTELIKDPDIKPLANNHVIIDLISGNNPVRIEFDRPYFDPDPDNGDIMPDSKRTIENHFRLEQISDFLGVALQPDGTIKNFPDPVFLENPSKQVPPNWNPHAFCVKKEGELVVEKGGVFEVRSNLISKDKYGDAQISPGGVVKYSTLLQRLDLQHDDIEKMLGGQEAGGLQIPRADKTGVMTYEGQTAMIADILYMLSCLSLRVEETNINAIRTVALNQAILRGMGLPVEFDKIPYATNGDQGEILVGKIPENAPTITDLIGIILQNLGKQVAGQLSIAQQPEVNNG